MKRYKITGDHCMFTFLTAKDSVTVFLDRGTIVETENGNVYAVQPDGTRRESIDYPSVMDIYVSRGEAEEVSVG